MYLIFSFLFYSHSKRTGVQLVSQCVMAKIIILLLLLLLLVYNTFSESLTDILSNSFHILKQRSDLFFHSDSVLPRVCVHDCLENSTLLGQPQAHKIIKI
jgi:hypothetical protein